jgi:hypothetical protein
MTQLLLPPYAIVIIADRAQVYGEDERKNSIASANLGSIGLDVGVSKPKVHCPTAKELTIRMVQ